MIVAVAIAVIGVGVEVGTFVRQLQSRGGAWPRTAYANVSNGTSTASSQRGQHVDDPPANAAAPATSSEARAPAAQQSNSALSNLPLLAASDLPKADLAAADPIPIPTNPPLSMGAAPADAKVGAHKRLQAIDDGF
jgi:hypothetical protein